MPKISMSKIPGSYNKRVFIGGDYSHYPLIREMKRTVSDLGFTPIVANEFEMREEEIHDCTMRLLHSCKNAIFDVSTISGALMEIERIRDYNTRALIVFSIKEKTGIPKQQVTRMIDPALSQRGYRDFEELHRIIENFLVVEDFLMIFLILCGAAEIAAGKEPNIEDKDFKRMYRDLYSGKFRRETIVWHIFDIYNVRPPSLTAREFVKKIYKTVLRRSPSESEIKRKSFILEKNYRTWAQLFLDIIYSEENLQKITKGYKYVQFKRREKGVL